MFNWLALDLSFWQQRAVGRRHFWALIRMGQPNESALMSAPLPLSLSRSAIHVRVPITTSSAMLGPRRAPRRPWWERWTQPELIDLLPRGSSAAVRRGSATRRWEGDARPVVRAWFAVLADQLQQETHDLRIELCAGTAVELGERPLDAARRLVRPHAGQATSAATGCDRRKVCDRVMWAKGLIGPRHHDI